MGLFAGAIENGLHQPPPEPAVLDVGIYGNRAHPSDRRALVEKIAADDFAIELCHDTEEMRMRKQHSHEFSTDLDGGNIGWEVVMGSDGAKCIEQDPRAW